MEGEESSSNEDDTDELALEDADYPGELVQDSLEGPSAG